MPSRLTPEQLSQLNRSKGHRLHSLRDSREVTAPARQAFLDGFERQVDPDGVLDPAERARRAEHARKAYFSELAYKSSRKHAERRSAS